MLTLLFCNGNQLTTAALNALFGTLHSNRGYINIEGNPGEEDCNRSIAKNKGWSFFSGEFNGKEEEAPFNSSMSDREKIKVAGYKELKVYSEYDSEPKKLEETYKYNNKGQVIGYVKHEYYDSDFDNKKYIYNNKDLLIEEQYLYGDYPGTTIKYTYNDRGLLIEEHHTDKTEGQNISIKSVNKYNNMDLLIETIAYSNGRVVYSIKYKHDDYGNIIEEQCSYREELYWSKEYDYTKKYKYNNKDLCIEETQYNSNGDIDFKYTYKYNENGLKIEMARYFKDGELASKETYEYR
jgi:YD repeat-containing protein